MCSHTSVTKATSSPANRYFRAILTLTLVIVAIPAIASPSQDTKSAEDAAAAQKENARGVELAQEEKWGEALTAFQEALRLDPELAEAHFNVGIVHGAQENWSEALSSYDRAIALKSDYTEAHYQRGMVLLALGEAWDGTEAFEAAIEARPDFAAGYMALGNTWASLQMAEPAIAAYRQVAVLRPESAEARFRLAVALFGAEQYADAWKEVHHAQDLGMDVHTGFLAALREAMPEPEHEENGA